MAEHLPLRTGTHASPRLRASWLLLLATAALVGLSLVDTKAQTSETPRKASTKLPREQRDVLADDLGEETATGGRPVGEVVRTYGSTIVDGEGVVSMALRWLVEHQMPDGGWSFDHTQAPKCQGQCGNPGQLSEARNAATGLALLCFLGGGNTPTSGPHKETVKDGFDFLIGQMKVSDERGRFYEAGGTMYSHGIATLVLSEAYGMTADEKLRFPAQQAINFIAYVQDAVGGGWRYQPRQRGDMSVTGWQLTALKSAQMGELRVPPITMARASRFLDSVQANDGANYGYTEPALDREATTAIGLLMRIYSGWDKDNPALQRGVQWLSERGPSKRNLYYSYYGTRLMLQIGGDEWTKWNGKMRDSLVETQSQEGHEKGSWYFAHGDLGSSRGGRLYCTAMATMTLEVYYRHLPIYERPSDRQRWRGNDEGSSREQDRTLPQ